MPKKRLDQTLASKGFVASRSQAESYIKLGQVLVNKKIITRPGTMINENDSIALTIAEQYVSRAALKLASAVETFKINFEKKVVIDVGSSTGGFTDYAIRHGAIKVIAVELGTEQLHASLRSNPKVELHEKTDIRVFDSAATPDIVLIDVSFISLREILPSIVRLTSKRTDILAMVKPQFEAVNSNFKHKGVIKNDHIRRDIFKNFELWVNDRFVIIDKADSTIAGAKGNQERFYWLKLPVSAKGR